MQCLFFIIEIQECQLMKRLEQKVAPAGHYEKNIRSHTKGRGSKINQYLQKVSILIKTLPLLTSYHGTNTNKIFPNLIVFHFCHSYSLHNSVYKLACVTH